MIEARAPGKLYIAGEYAVVKPGQPAVLIAVDKYLTVQVSAIERTGMADALGRVYSDEYEEGSIEWTHHGAGIRVAPGHDHVTRAIEIVHLLRTESGQRNTYFDLHIDSELADGSGRKFGLGSSAAAVVATIDALNQFYGMNLTSAQRFQLALLATIAISPAASGGDIAASTCGGWLYYTSPDRVALRAYQLAYGVLATLSAPGWRGCSVQPLPELKSLRLLVGWTGTPASTDALVEQAQDETLVERYASYVDESYGVVTDLVDALSSDQTGVLGAIRRSRRAMKRLEKTGRIETRMLGRLADIAEEYGGAGKPSGAGGGDCGIAVVAPGAGQTDILRQWEAHAIMPLDLLVHPSGGNTYEF